MRELPSRRETLLPEGKSPPEGTRLAAHDVRHAAAGAGGAAQDAVALAGDRRHLAVAPWAVQVNLMAARAQIVQNVSSNAGFGAHTTWSGSVRVERPRKV